MYVLFYQRTSFFHKLKKLLSKFIFIKISRFCTTLRVITETSQLNLLFKLYLFTSKHPSERFFKDLLYGMKTTVKKKFKKNYQRSRLEWRLYSAVLSHQYHLIDSYYWTFKNVTWLYQRNSFGLLGLFMAEKMHLNKSIAYFKNTEHISFLTSNS